MYETLAFSAGKPLRFWPENQPIRAGSRPEAVRFSAGAPSCRASVGTSTANRPAVSSGRMRAASLYDVLRVNETASLTEIKTAYRSLAKVYHPDASESDGRDEDFIEIHNAYATLSDPRARALYDMSMGARRRGPLGSRGGARPIRVYTTRRWETDQCW